MDFIYEYRKDISGAPNTLVADAPTAWIDTFISRVEFESLFGGYLVSSDSDDKRVRYRGVWAKDKVRKLKRMLRERGAVFEVCNIDGASRWIHTEARYYLPSAPREK